MLPFLILVMLTGGCLCQRLAAGNPVDFHSKFVVDDEYPQFLASQIEESPVWNYESDLGDARGDSAIDPADLSDAPDDSLSDQLEDSQLGASPDTPTSVTPTILPNSDAKSSPKEPALNNLQAVNSLKEPDDDQQFEQFGLFQNVNQPKLQSLYENREQALRSPYGNLDETGFGQFSPAFPVLSGKKAPREAYKVPRNLFVDFASDDDLEDFSGFGEPKFDQKNRIQSEKKNVTNDKSSDKNEANSGKVSEEPRTRSNDKRQARNRTAEPILFENYGFDDLNFKLDDDLDEKTNERPSDPPKAKKAELGEIKKEPADKKEASDEEKKDSKQAELLKKDIIPILKHKPKFMSRVVYSDDDEILITEDKKNNATTISLPKTTDFVDEPSKEPRIRKLRRLRRLRKQPRPKPASFADEFDPIKDDLPGSLNPGLKDSIQAAIDDEQRLRNGLQAMKKDAKNMKAFTAKTESIDQQTEKVNADGKSPDGGGVVKNSSKSRVIRIVKVTKKNPETQQIESNVTFIDSRNRDGSNDTLKSDLNKESNGNLKGVSKDELKTILDDVTKDVLKDESKTVLKGAPMDKPMDKPRSLFQTSRDRTKNEQLKKRPNINYDDFETNKSDIKRVLYK